MRAVLLASVLIAACSACASGPATTGPAKVDLPVTDGVSRATASRKAPRESPPPSGTAKESSFPPVAASKLANGMGLDVVASKALPIVQVRLLVRAGTGYGPEPGVAELTTSLLKDGGTRTMPTAEVLRRVETLGADLLVRTETDASVIGLALTKDKLDAGLAILSEVVREPRFDPDELRKLRSRAIDQAENTARASGSWTATWLLFHELFPAKSPYAMHDALPSQLAKVDLAEIRDFHRRFFVPKAATLILAGDVDEATAKDLAQRHFGAWTGGEPPKLDFPPPRLPDKRRVVLAHRPRSVQSDVFVVTLAAPRHDEHWPAARVANQVLGGGVASRLFSDVREQRSLAYATHSQIQELAHGPQPLVLDAGTESTKTADAARGLLENLQRLSASPPSPAETVAARRFLSDIFAIRMETVRAIAEMVVTQETFGLSPDYWEQYRRAVRGIDAAGAAAAASTFDAAHALVVVAGDADVVGPSLAHLGDVEVVDPEKEFKPMRTIPSAKP